MTSTGVLASRNVVLFPACLRSRSANEHDPDTGQLCFCVGDQQDNSTSGALEDRSESCFGLELGPDSH